MSGGCALGALRAVVAEQLSCGATGMAMAEAIAVAVGKRDARGRGTERGRKIK